MENLQNEQETLEMKLTHFRSAVELVGNKFINKHSNERNASEMVENTKQLDKKEMDRWGVFQAIVKGVEDVDVKLDKEYGDGLIGYLKRIKSTIDGLVVDCDVEQKNIRSDSSIKISKLGFYAFVRNKLMVISNNIEMDIEEGVQDLSDLKESVADLLV